jgi:hypothetical protein
VTAISSLLDINDYEISEKIYNDLIKEGVALTHQDVYVLFSGKCKIAHVRLEQKDIKTAQKCLEKLNIQYELIFKNMS